MKVDDDGWFGGGRGGWRGRAARAGGECLEIAKVWCFLVDSNYLCVYRRYHTHQFLATFNRQLLSTLPDPTPKNHGRTELHYFQNL